MNILIEISGWVGTFLIVLAYFLISYNKIEADSKNYQLMNFFGAITIGINVYHKQSWSTLALEFVWAAIAIMALVKKKSVSKYN